MGVQTIEKEQKDGIDRLISSGLLHCPSIIINAPVTKLGTKIDGCFLVQFLEDSVVNTMESSNMEGNLDGKTILAGTMIYSRFNRINLTSGSCIAYLES